MVEHTNFISQAAKEAYEKQFSKSQNLELEKLDFNPLQIYFGDDYKVNNKITIHQPKVQDFIDYGEDNINSIIIPFVSNTTSQRVKLWDLGIDWNKISEQQLFALLIKSVNIQYSKILFGDLDLSSFDLFSLKKGDEEVSILYSEKMNMEITEDDREKMCKYIQYMFNIFPPEPEFTSNKILKEELVNNDRIKELAKQKDLQGSVHMGLLSKISFCLNHPGFKYKRDDLRNMGFVEFLDSVQRLQIYESTHALLIGANSGFVDTTKINKNEFNFMRDIKVTA